jgi:hypothetical protein
MENAPTPDYSLMENAPTSEYGFMETIDELLKRVNGKDSTHIVKYVFSVPNRNDSQWYFACKETLNTRSHKVQCLLLHVYKCSDIVLSPLAIIDFGKIKRLRYRTKRIKFSENTYISYYLHTCPTPIVSHEVTDEMFQTTILNYWEDVKNCVIDNRDNVGYFYEEGYGVLPPDNDELLGKSNKYY